MGPRDLRMWPGWVPWSAAPGPSSRGWDVAVETSGAGTPPLQAFGANATAKPTRELLQPGVLHVGGATTQAGRRAPRVAPLGRPRHPCAVRVLGSCTGPLVALGRGEGSARPKWLEPGFQKLPRQGTLSWMLWALMGCLHTAGAPQAPQGGVGDTLQKQFPFLRIPSVGLCQGWGCH